MNSGSITSLSLLLQLRQEACDEQAWHQFVDRYGSRIYQWSLNRRLQPHDAEDVTQEVLVKLARHLKTFDYDASKSFRGWLRRITENALADFLREQHRRRGKLDDSLCLLEAADAREELIDRLRDAFDLELLDQALQAVRRRVTPARFQAWELSVQSGLCGAEIALRLNMKIASVYTAKNQVQVLIQQEVKRLEELAEPE